MNWPMLALLALAAARATHLVADDDFPFGGLREWLNSYTGKGRAFLNWLGSGLGCTFCVSIHAGFWSALLAYGLGWQPYGFFLGGWADLGGFTVVWFAISAAVVLLESWVDVWLSS